ncbi:glutaredoxin [bacterium]|nr:MAG: glutaredoxin [bacterium]
MPILSEKDKQEISKRLSQMIRPVKLLLFSQKLGDCQYCASTEELMGDLCSLSDKINLEKFNFITDKDAVDRYKIDKIPAIIVAGENEKNEIIDYGIRFFGIPAGYEFASFLETILMVSHDDSRLSEKSKKDLKQLNKPVHIQVFITPSCPHCQSAVLMAHMVAYESNMIRSDMIESMEFPDFANKNLVHVVPKVILNDSTSFEGALPEEQFISNILSVGKSSE